MSVVGLAIGFLMLVHLFETATLIIVLNGVFFGCVAALAVTFGPLLWYTLLGLDPYDRVRQMTLSFVLGWVIMIGLASNSFYVRAADLQTTTLVTTALWRYLSIIMAVMQVTVPDFGLGIFHGRERKTLWTGIAVGTIVAGVTIYMQAINVLAPFVTNALSKLAYLA